MRFNFGQCFRNFEKNVLNSFILWTLPIFEKRIIKAAKCLLQNWYKNWKSWGKAIFIPRINSRSLALQQRFKCHCTFRLLKANRLGRAWNNVYTLCSADRWGRECYGPLSSSVLIIYLAITLFLVVGLVEVVV